MKAVAKSNNQLHQLKCAALALKVAAQCFRTAAPHGQTTALKKQSAADRRETCAEDEPQRGEIEGKSRRPKVERTSRERGEVAARSRAVATPYRLSHPRQTK